MQPSRRLLRRPSRLLPVRLSPWGSDRIGHGGPWAFPFLGTYFLWDARALAVSLR
jgi:hypothetical protein